MKLSIIGTVLTLVFLVYAIVVLSHFQELLMDTPNPKSNVPGRNHAYYTQVMKDDQIFRVRELLVYPDAVAL